MGLFDLYTNEVVCKKNSDVKKTSVTNEIQSLIFTLLFLGYLFFMCGYTEIFAASRLELTSMFSQAAKTQGFTQYPLYGLAIVYAVLLISVFSASIYFFLRRAQYCLKKTWIV